MSFPSDRLGPRDLSADFTETIELVHSVLLYDPDSVFYLIRLVANGLRRIVSTEVGVCDDLLSAVDDLAQPNRPVTSVSGLRTARNALLNMQSSIVRGGSLGSAEYRKYAAGVSRTKQELARAVKMTYTPRGSSTTTTDIVRPLPEARTAVVQAYRTLRLEHAQLLTAVQRTLSAFSQFSSGNLVAKLGERQVARALAQIDELYELLDPLEPDERTYLARTALLKVLSNEATIKAMSARSLPGQSKLTQKPSATPTMRMVAYGDGTAPALVGTVSGPFPLSATARYLEFTVLNDDPAPPTVDLLPGGASDIPAIKAAALVGAQTGRFSINGDLATPWPLVSAAETYDTRAAPVGNGSLFYIIVDGTSYRKTLTVGAAVTAATVAADISAAAGWTPSQPPISAAAVGGKVVVSYTGSTLPYRARSMEVIPGVWYAQDLWPWTSGTVGATAATRTQGWDANNKLRVKANDDPSYVEVTLPSGTWPDYLVDAGPVGTPGTVAAAIDSAGGAEFTSSAPSATGRVTVQSELEGEGSIITILSEGLYVAPHAKAGYATASKLGMQTLGFAESQEVRESDIDARAVANVLNNSAINDEAVATVQREEFFHSRGATRSAAATLQIIFEGDDPTTAWPAYTQVKVAISNGANRGIYGLSGPPTVVGQKLLLDIDRTLRDSTSGLRHTITVYRERLVITSKDSGVTGALKLDDPGNSARTALGLSTTQANATVGEVLVEELDSIYGWRPLDISRRRIRVNDRILAGTLVQQTVVSGVSNAVGGRLQVSPEVSPSLSLDTEGFYIQSAAYVAYKSFSEALASWQAATLPPFEENLNSLDKVIAPVLLSVPSKDRVDTLYTRIETLRDKLAATGALLDIIDDFTVARIGSVDLVLRTLLEQGFNRARDLLLQGRFTAFFSTTSRDSSYARAFQKAVNEVAVEDVNQSAAARSRWDAEFVRISAQWEEDVDPRYDFSDFEEELPESPVVDFYPGVNEYEGD